MKIMSVERPNEIEVINTGFKECCVNPFDETVRSYEAVTNLVSDVIDVCKKTTGEIDMIEVSLYNSGKTISNCAFPGKDFDMEIVPLEISTLDDNLVRAKLVAVIFDLIRNTINDMRHFTTPCCDIRVTRYCITLVHVENELVKKIIIHCDKCIVKEFTEE